MKTSIFAAKNACFEANNSLSQRDMHSPSAEVERERDEPVQRPEDRPPGWHSGGVLKKHAVEMTDHHDAIDPADPCPIKTLPCLHKGHAEHSSFADSDPVALLEEGGDPVADKE